MNRTDLNRAVAGTANTTIVKAEEVLDAALARMAEALRRGEEVRLPGFGIFKVVQLAAREGRGPDGTPYACPARATVRFHPAKALEQTLARGGT